MPSQKESSIPIIHFQVRLLLVFGNVHQSPQKKTHTPSQPSTLFLIGPWNSPTWVMVNREIVDLRKQFFAGGVGNETCNKLIQNSRWSFVVFACLQFEQYEAYNLFKKRRLQFPRQHHSYLQGYSESWIHPDKLKLSFPSHARQMHFGIAVLQRAWVHTVCVAARYTQSAGNVAKGICIKTWQTHDFGWKTFAFRAIPNTKLIIWSQGLPMVVGTLGKRGQGCLWTKCISAYLWKQTESSEHLASSIYLFISFSDHERL